MAKIKESSLDPARPRRGKGDPVICRDPRGTYVRSAPRFNSSFNAYWRWWMREEFKLAARWACAPEPMSYETAVFMARGTEFIPRDILMMAIMGTYYEIVMPNGVTLENGRMATSNVQYILSLLDPDKGAVITFDGTSWNPLPIGAEGQVLTVNSNLAVWRNPTGGGGGGDVSQANWKLPTTFFDHNDTGAFATLSNAIYVAETCAIDGLRATVNAASAGVTYSAFIAEITTAGAIVATLGTAITPQTAAASGAVTFTFDLPKVTLNPGTPYLLAVVITSGTGTTASRPYLNSTSSTPGYSDGIIDLGMMLKVWTGNCKRFWYAQNSDHPTSGAASGNSVNGQNAIAFHLVAP